MKTYYVYILKCNDELIYIGVTNNISRRFEEHQQGMNKNCFTYKRRPLKLIFSQEFNDINQAIYFEKKIKKWSAKKKLALAYGEYDYCKFYLNVEMQHIQNTTQKTIKVSTALDLTKIK